MAAKSAIVIGGGIGGLSAALQLRSSGYDVCVFEAREELSEVNTGLSLWAFAVRRLGEIGLADGVAAIGSRSSECPSRPQRSASTAPGRSAWARLHRFWAEVHLSRDRWPRAQAVFEDRGTVDADVLVGADGVHSVVRDTVCPDAVLRRGQVGVWRGTVPVQGGHVGRRTT